MTSTHSVARARPDTGRPARSAPYAWEDLLAHVLLWAAPVAAFVLVMLMGGGARL